MKNKGISLLFFSFLCLLAVGCGQDKLQTLEATAISKVSQDSMCMAPPESQTKWHKVMFIVDKSGSNERNDPDDVRRADNIDQFVVEHGDDEFTEFAYLAFGINESEVESYISGDDGSPAFGDKQDLIDAVAQHRADPDEGCTPYLSALEHAKGILERDIQIMEERGEEAVYNIFFLSDGFPTDEINNGADGCGNGQLPVTNEPDDVYLNKVEDVVALSPGKVFLSTAYYTPPENDEGRVAANGLEYMARAGGGYFVDLQNNDKIDFNQITVGQKPESWILKRMVVYNMSSAFCSDGTISGDSDSDGICDKDEITYNQIFSASLGSQQFDPQNRNSINPSYSDLFAFKFSILPTGDGLEPCNLSLEDPDFDTLNECEERALLDSQANGPTEEWTEDMRQNHGGSASPYNPDSDGDGFMDSIEYFQFGVQSGPVDYTNLTDSYSGVTAEQLMIEHRHPQDVKEFGSENYDVDIKYKGLNERGENCYTVDFNQVPLYAVSEVSQDQVSGHEYLSHGENENVVLVYYITVREKDPNGAGYLFYSYQKIKKDSDTGPSINAFEKYRIPETESEADVLNPIGL